MLDVFSQRVLADRCSVARLVEVGHGGCGEAAVGDGPFLVWSASTAPIRWIAATTPPSPASTRRSHGLAQMNQHMGAAAPFRRVNSSSGID